MSLLKLVLPQWSQRRVLQVPAKQDMSMGSRSCAKIWLWLFHGCSSSTQKPCRCMLDTWTVFGNLRYFPSKSCSGLHFTPHHRCVFSISCSIKTFFPHHAVCWSIMCYRGSFSLGSWCPPPHPPRTHSVFKRTHIVPHQTHKLIFWSESRHPISLLLRNQASCQAPASFSQSNSYFPAKDVLRTSSVCSAMCEKISKII